MLGSGQSFGRYVRRLAEARTYGPLRELVRCYILRRLKTDKSVIADLPDKTEMKAFCYLSAAQAALYQKAIGDLADALERAEGIGRKGIVLSFLMRLKQICNHPSQWLGDGAWAETESGKFARLRELADVIAEKQEKMLVFTQFREATQPIAAFLGRLFGREGAQIDRLGKRVDAKLERAKARSQQVSREFEAKVETPQKKADKEKGDAKAAIESRIARLRNDYQNRQHA